MELRCLSCNAEVRPGTVQLCYKVFVCEACKANGEDFVETINADIRTLQHMLVVAVRKGLVDGVFSDDWKNLYVNYTRAKRTTRIDRLRLLLELISRVEKERSACQSQITPSIQTSSPPEQSSGDGIEPHVQTLAVLAKKSSNSPDQ